MKKDGIVGEKYGEFGGIAPLEASKPVVDQRLSLQEFVVRGSKLNALLVGVLQLLHGKEKHTEVEWVELYTATKSRKTK